MVVRKAHDIYTYSPTQSVEKSYSVKGEKREGNVEHLKFHVERSPKV
jgi:hypothetical protein